MVGCKSVPCCQEVICTVTSCRCPGILAYDDQPQQLDKGPAVDHSPGPVGASKISTHKGKGRARTQLVVGDVYLGLLGELPLVQLEERTGFAHHLS